MKTGKPMSMVPFSGKDPQTSCEQSRDHHTVRRRQCSSSGSTFSPAKSTKPSWGLQFHDVIFSSTTPQGSINRWIRGTGSQLMNFQGRGIPVKWAVAHSSSDRYQRTLIFKVSALLRRVESDLHKADKGRMEGFTGISLGWAITSSLCAFIRRKRIFYRCDWEKTYIYRLLPRVE